MIQNITTDDMPFSLEIKGENNSIVINENLKLGITSKLEAYSSLSRIEAYIKAGLTSEDIWEISKIQMEQNRQNMEFENMFVSIKDLQESIILFFNGTVENIKKFQK